MSTLCVFCGKLRYLFCFEMFRLCSKQNTGLFLFWTDTQFVLISKQLEYCYRLKVLNLIWRLLSFKLKTKDNSFFAKLRLCPKGNSTLYKFEVYFDFGKNI